MSLKKSLFRLIALSMPFAASAAENDFESFSEIGHYRAANAALKPCASRVVFMGDSITASWADEPFFADETCYVDRGISGQTAPQMLLRFRSDVIDLHPAVVHIMAGTNDVAENLGEERDLGIEGAIASMVELALAHRITVIVASIPPTTDFPWRPGLNPSPRIRGINAWLKAYAEKTRVAYLDYWPVLATADGGMKADLSPDGVHPNANGYRTMEPLARAAIERALQQRTRGGARQ
jgi:lysophospholipase L1-like esterase